MSISSRKKSSELFRDFHIRAVRYYAKLFLELGLTLPKYALLAPLTQIKSMTMTEASRRLMISKPALTQMVTRMSKEGLLKRCHHPNDRRSCLVQITGLGRARTERAQRAMVDIIVDNMDAFSKNERNVIHRFYERLTCVVEGRMMKLKPDNK